MKSVIFPDGKKTLNVSNDTPTRSLFSKFRNANAENTVNNTIHTHTH